MDMRITDDELIRRIKEFEFSIKQREETNRIERELIASYKAELERRVVQWVQKAGGKMVVQETLDALMADFEREE